MTKNKLVIYYIILISLVVVVCSVIAICSPGKAKFYPSAMSTDYTLGDNKSLTKEIYNTESMKSMFIEKYNELNSVLSEKLFDGSVTDEETLALAVEKYNRLLSENNYEQLGVEYCDLWIGKFYLNDKGILKFKFSIKEIEPEWIKDDEIASFVELN